jgi:glyoxylase-like metal-dependent hydrolase (beta-lactamase superfamily II)
VRELRPGLWHWEAPHPQWRPTEPWSENVSSYAIDDGERLLLFDPLAVPSELGDLAAGRETAIVLTAPWHERDAQSLVERLGVPVYTPLPDTAQYLMDTYGLTAEQAGDGSPDVVWLLREKRGEARPYSSGDRLPFGADVFPGHKANDTVLWVESQRAVISGDTLVDFGRGLEINERWLRPGLTREEIAEGFAPAARAAGRARARDARRADRPGRPRARAVLLLDRSRDVPARPPRRRFDADRLRSPPFTTAEVPPCPEPDLSTTSGLAFRISSRPSSTTTTS